MTTNHVANIVCKSLITGRKKIKPWWGIWGQIFSYVFIKQIAKQILKNDRMTE
ncbi:MAG: hypothetical protein JXL97_17230 [Bacteroidales bacterium]|nr:hypothetical protein [Bacteroidales bacterium]